jgi:hypothetical protein
MLLLLERSASADRSTQRQRLLAASGSFWQLLEAARSRYPALSYQEKGALVDELVELSGFHRKSVLWLLRQQPADHGGPPAAGADHDSTEVGRNRRYVPQVVQLLGTLWEVSCSRRSSAPLERIEHGHIKTAEISLVARHNGEVMQLCDGNERPDHRG